MIFGGFTKIFCAFPLIKYNLRNIVPQNHAENESGRLVLDDLFLLFKKGL